MEEITRQVKKAQWRLNLERFLRIVAWSLFATLLVGAIGVAIPKLWYVPVDANVWYWSWTGGSVGAGLLIALVMTLVWKRTAVDAALELDRRFGLKERVSSSLTLLDHERETEAGQALMQDATRRVEALDVAEQFRLTPGRRFALPLIPIAAIVTLFFLNNFTPPQQTQAATNALRIEKEIKKTKEEIKKILERKKEEMANKIGDKDAEVMFKQLAETLEKKKADDPKTQKEALLRLNDLTKDLQKKRDQLGGADKIKEQMSKLKDLEQGPADKAAKAMQQGDFKKAEEELKKLQDKLEKGDLTKEDKQQLAKQLDQMQKKMEEVVQKHEQAKKELEKQIKDAENAGDRQKAGELQQKLDAMKNADKQMEKMQQMADQFAKAAEKAKNGDAKQAAEELKQLAQEMKEMQKDLDKMQMVDEMMNELADAQNGLCERCKNGDQPGDDGMEGDEGEGDGKDGKEKGKGKGRGGLKPGTGITDGQGNPDKLDKDPKFYGTKVTGKVKRGEAVKSGTAGGPNMTGKTSESVKQEIQSATIEEDDPLVNQRLPKSQRENAKQYFDNLRKGE